MSGGLFGARIPRRAKTIRLRHGHGKKRAITLSAASNQAGAEKVRQGPGGSATARVSPTSNLRAAGHEW